MASSLSNLKSPAIHIHHRNPISIHFLLRPCTLSFPSPRHRLYRFPNCAVKTWSTGGRFRSGGGGEDAYSTSADVLKKAVVSPAEDFSGVSDDDGEDEDGDKGQEVLVDWEDPILEDTVPIVGFVRMILHSGKYESGDRLSPEHEKTILERLLPYHPECEKKIGCGVDYITVGYHPHYESSRCLFIVRKDGEMVDFSYWKCIKGLVRKKYPLYADNFILRHFRWRRRIE